MAMKFRHQPNNVQQKAQEYREQGYLTSADAAKILDCTPSCARRRLPEPVLRLHSGNVNIGLYTREQVEAVRK